MITVDIFLLIIIGIIFYYGYLYVYNILSHPIYPQHRILLQMLLIGIIVNMIIYLIITLYHYYKFDIQMIGRPGRKGERGESGDVGDSQCPESSLRSKIPNSGNFTSILDKKLSVTTLDDGLSLSYNPISTELETNSKSARFAVNNLISQRPIYIKNDQSNPGKYLMLLDDLKNERKLYLSVSRQPINKILNDIETDDYFPPSDYMGTFAQNGIPLILKGNPEHCLIEIDFQGNRFALVREKREGTGISVEDGQFALIFRRNGKPTPLKLREIDKYKNKSSEISSDSSINWNIDNDDQNEKQTPIYQYYNQNKNDYLFIDEVSEVPSGYNYQGLAFKISKNIHNDAKPLYLCYNRENDKHFLSNLSKCSDAYQGNNSLVKHLGYLSQTSSDLENNQSLKRCFNPGLKAYMSQKESLIRNCLELGYSDEKALGFLE